MTGTARAWQNLAVSSSINEAAERLGIRDSAVRTAVIEGRLPSWIKDG